MQTWSSMGSDPAWRLQPGSMTLLLQGGIFFLPWLFQKKRLAAGRSQDTKRWYQYLREGMFPPNLCDNPDIPRLLSPVRRNMTNKGSSFPKIPLGCLRDEVPEAGEGDVEFPAVFAARGPWMATGSPSRSPEQLGVAQTCQVGHEPENFLQLLWQKRRQPCSPAQRCRARGDCLSFSSCLWLPGGSGTQRGGLEKLWFLHTLTHRDFILSWMILAPP